MALEWAADRSAWSPHGIYRIEQRDGRWMASFAEVPPPILERAISTTIAPQRAGAFVDSLEDGIAWCEGHALNWRPPKR
jgi:hypothetical protein